ncbi:LOW QUALITY PROTEIN: E3 ubiquitin-protein ligase listerin-like [Haliotis rubra]|uniref:LOW QUALITY PROTEIN: E3 ubiquitin-protein ligase listerin-like n=1 Tax=Haliotis rubra TaxID=36100 RepID=UPI001EE4F711|nr:LOW QUALITY PROTEIN: E3 ubiquitin-protein ligase listerin-like [Haliotis rubra]
MPSSGGKKGAQRTKGNVKPSSSSQAAELLAQTGAGRTGFIGFGSMGSPAYVPASESFDDVDSSLDSDFRMVLRKLSKRDSTTKIKALQEFAGLCEEKGEECLKGVLPFWPRIYNKMSIDVDHRVREATQQAMTTLVSRVRRNIAPYLKSVMGSWLLSQCDTYPTVSTSATQAFQSAFPPAKQTDAIDYCKTDITEFLVENLTSQTPATLSEPRTSTQEEMETRYSRVVTSSFLALRKLLLSLPAASPDALTEHMQGLLKEGKFWKHSKSTVSSIKSAQYSFCASLCQILPNVAQEYITKLSPLILHNIDSSDPVLCSALWEAVLSLVKFLPDSWNHVSWTKAVWPKLRTLLENGCHGNASVIGPNLLPLLSQIPGSLSGESKKFYMELFTCFRTGLGVESVQQSVSESSALVTSLFECCQYTVKELADNQGETINCLLLDQVLPVVESSLMETKSTLYKTPLYGMFAQLTTALERTDSGVSLSSMCYRHLLQMIEETYPTLTNTPHFSHILQQTSLPCVRAAQTQHGHQGQDRQGKFADDLTVEDLKLGPVEMSDSSQVFVNSVSSYVFTKCFQAESVEFLSVFSRIFNLYNSNEMVETLLTISSLQAGTNVYLSFVSGVIIPWVTKEQTSNKEDHVMCLLDVVMVCLSQVEDSQALDIMTQLAKGLTSPVLLCNLINKALEIHDSTPSVSSWLKSSVLTDRIISLGDDICKMTTESSGNQDVLEHGWSLITLVLSASVNEGPVFDAACIEQTLGVIYKTLQQLGTSGSKDRVDKAVTFVAKATKTFFQNLMVCPSLDSVENLMLALFTVYIDSDYPVTDRTREEVHEALNFGLYVIVRQTGAYLRSGGFLEKSAELTRTLISSRTQTLPVLQHVCLCVNKVLATLRDNLPDASHTDPTIQALLNTFFITAKADDYAQIQEYMTIRGLLSLTSLVKKRPTTTLPALMFTTLFNAMLLMYKGSGDMTLTLTRKASLTSISSKEQGQDGREITAVTWEKEDLERLLDCLTQSIITRWWADNDKTVHRFPDLTSGLDQLKVKVRSLVTVLDSESQRKLLNMAMTRSEETGGIASVSLSTLLDILKTSQSEVSLSDDAVIDRCSTLTTTSLHTLQCSTSYVSEHARLTAAQILNARFITTPADSSTQVDGGVGLLGVLNMTLPHVDTESPEVKDIFKSTLSQIIMWKQETEDLMLFTCDLSEADLDKIATNVEVMNFVQLYVTLLPQELGNTDWDFIMCSTIAWVQTVAESEHLLASQTSVSVFTIRACQLLGDVVNCIDTRIRTSPSSFPDNLLTEWDEFFSEGVFSILLPLYVRLVAKSLQTTGGGLHDNVISSMGLAISCCPKQHVLGLQLPANLIAEDLSPLPDSLQSLLNTFSPMMLYSSASVQVTAFRVLNRIVSELPAYEQEDKDEVEQLQEEDKRNDESSKPPHAVNKVCMEGAAAMDIVLCDAGLEECFTIAPNTDEFRYTMGYLLSWKLILKLFKSSPSVMRTTSYIDKFTKKHVSPLLCHSEISSVQATDEELDGIEIKARPKIREVIAKYTMSEVSVEVVISLPENYPLGSITVVSDKKVGVTQSQWDRWLLHLNIFLQHQNGSIIEGLKLWKKNIDKRFEGVDDCMICYSVLHGTNFQLPRLQCRTCKKKFHSACLYKWFSTSHNSSCPLCRNLF